MVVLAGETQHFTYEEKVQTSAFQISEAALDAGMYAMVRAWPEAGGQPPVMDVNAFEDQVTQFGGIQAPAGGAPIATWEFYDNNGASGNAGTDQSDENGDNLMYVRVTGRVGDKDATLQALVQRTPFEANLPKGIAVYASGDIDSNGGGNNPKVNIAGSPSTGVSAIAGGTILAPSVIDPRINAGTRPTARRRRHSRPTFLPS